MRTENAPEPAPAPAGAALAAPSASGPAANAARGGSPASPGPAPADAADPGSAAPAPDPAFLQEQQHLASTYAQLQEMAAELVRKMEHTRAAAAEDKRSMAGELAPNFATYADAMETYADFAAMNRVIDAYNLAQNADAEQLAKIRLLLEQPYFAKVVLRFKPGQDPKELYIGTAGVSDASCRRLVVDWRSPVAEVYYNQDLGPTSYVADGRTINANLELRRQFDIERDRLNAYFDTSVAIQDSLLLASLSKRRTAQMQAITATIQKEQNLVVRHEDVPVLLVSGIAGSGKTSVMLQRIAYLFYRLRGSLDASEVFLVSPNPVFRNYIAGVLPDLGERNPESLTWDEFARGLLPASLGSGNAGVPLSALARIDAACARFEFEAGDFRDIRVGDVRLIGAEAIRKVSDKFRRAPAGPHRVALVREELHARLEARLAQMAGTEAVLDEMAALPVDEQLRIFHETYDPADEKEERALALRYVARALRQRVLGRGKRRLAAHRPHRHAPLARGGPRPAGMAVPENGAHRPGQPTGEVRHDRRGAGLHRRPAGGAGALLPPRALPAARRPEPGHRAAHGHLRRGARRVRRLARAGGGMPAGNQLPLHARDHADVRRPARRRTARPPLVHPARRGAALHRRLRGRGGLPRRAARGRGRRTAGRRPRGHRRSLEARGEAPAELLGDGAPELADDTGALPASGLVLLTLTLAKGLEFDRVIVPDASARVFPGDPLSRRRLYTTVSRATRGLTILAHGELTPLLKR